MKFFPTYNEIIDTRKTCEMKGKGKGRVLYMDKLGNQR
jgi:hypothetical protein